MERERRRMRLLFGVAIVALGISLFFVYRAERSRERAAVSAQIEVAATTAADGSGSTFPSCTDCHQDLDRNLRDEARRDLVYTHEEHFATGVADCRECHPENTHEADETRRPTMKRCFACHGTAETASAPGTCTTCHPPGMRVAPPSHLDPGWVPREHARQAKADQLECLTCHNTERFCTSCHGVTLPHPQDWATTPHAEASFELGIESCEGCHARAPNARDSCDVCHHPLTPEDAGWRAAHPVAVKEQGASGCFDCHDAATCVTCHSQGRETFEADR